MKLDQLIQSTIESRALRKFIAKALTTHNLTFGEFEILYLMNNKKTLQPTHISNELHQDSGTVSRVLSRLHEKNLIAYTNDDKDRRRVFVDITNSGKQLLFSFVNSLGE